MIGKIHSIETFGTVDGPGIRYVIFVQGCPMRCAYCHNPDTWDMSSGNEMSASELLEDITKYKRYIEGITVSGGEPFLQIDFLIELFKGVKAQGLTTCIDTSGILFNVNNIDFLNKLNKLLIYTDLIMLDVKHIDDNKHRKLTGYSNKSVLEFSKYIDSKNINIWLRYVLVPGVNDDENTLIKWKDFANTLRNLKKIEVLPYHKLGIEKYKKLGIKYSLENTSEPTREQVEFARKILMIKENIR